MKKLNLLLVIIVIISVCGCENNSNENQWLPNAFITIIPNIGTSHPVTYQARSFVYENIGSEMPLDSVTISINGQNVDNGKTSVIETLNEGQTVTINISHPEYGSFSSTMQVPKDIRELSCKPDLESWVTGKSKTLELNWRGGEGSNRFYIDFTRFNDQGDSRSLYCSLPSRGKMPPVLLDDQFSKTTLNKEPEDAQYNLIHTRITVSGCNTCDYNGGQCRILLFGHESPPLTTKSGTTTFFNNQADKIRNVKVINYVK